MEGMREACRYAAKSKSGLILAVEPVGRFESHFLNIAEDAVYLIERPPVKPLVDIPRMADARNAARAPNSDRRRK